jgi:hypothetical protein
LPCFEATFVRTDFDEFIEMQLTDNGPPRKGFADPMHYRATATMIVLQWRQLNLKRTLETG